MIATLKNLKDAMIDKGWSDVIMVCSLCEVEFSANLADYWQLPEGYIFRHCDNTIMELARKSVELTELD